MTSAADDDVVFEERDGIGLITLNRPRARNALTTAMVLSMGERLRAWESDRDVRAVLIRGAGDHGLCAGGDVKAMRSSAIARDGEVVEFFRAEYRLNGQVSAYSKPYIALMDGITMGGGVGVSAHGSVRIVTERTAFAMPEVAIGIAPDVGATWLLSHVPGELGAYAGLTGATLTAGDVLHLGLADHFVPSGRLGELTERIATDGVESAVHACSASAPASALASSSEWIDECFALDSVSEVLAALDASPEPRAHDAAQLIRTKSPTAVAVTLASLRRARALPGLDAALEQEFIVSCNLVHGHDAIEGVRALIVDKDQSPAWDPPSTDAVTAETIHRAFVNRGYGTLGLA
jgi:enoyl-CoA hydratase/carnithine racemase